MTFCLSGILQIHILSADVWNSTGSFSSSVMSVTSVLSKIVTSSRSFNKIKSCLISNPNNPGRTVRADIRLDIRVDIRLDIRKITYVRVELSVQPLISKIKSPL